jgi:hypothetical protein
MESVDVQEQWHDLRETYSQMREEELRRVAEDAFDLTQIAREALQSVIAERGLKIQLAEAPPPPEPTLSDAEAELDLVTVCQVKSDADARRAKSILDANFIASCLGPENVADLEKFKGSFTGVIDLKVFPEYAHRAATLLDQYAPDLMRLEDEPREDDDRDYAITCPKCQSEDIVLDEADPHPVDSKILYKYRWTCAACGNEWQDSGFVHIVNSNARGHSSSSD